MKMKLLLAGIVGITTASCSASDGGGDASPGGAAGSPTTGSGGSPSNGGSASVAGATSSAGAPMTSGGAPGAAGASMAGASTFGGGGAGGVSGASTGGSAAGNATAGVSGGGAAGAGGGQANGGSKSSGGSGGAAGSGGSGGGAGQGAGGRINNGMCTESKATGTNVTGSGPHQVVVETNSDAGIREGTIYRPKDLGGTEKYPIFVWGEGGCARQGLSNSAAMAEIASHGYFVVADGPPSGGGSNRPLTSDYVGMGKPLIAYIDWAIAENDKPCSAYYQALNATKVSANGFSCGGLMSAGTAGDPRITTWGHTSSGTMGGGQNFYRTVHTPVMIVLGGESDIAYPNGKADYEGIQALGHPIMLFSKNIGHGGDLGSRGGGDFTKINLAWLNWQLKGDETATGKGRLVGAGCTYCTDPAWEVMSANLP